MQACTCKNRPSFLLLLILLLMATVHSQTFSAWTSPVNLGSPPNSPNLEQGVFISKDGLSLYFQSDRTDLEHYGGLDIFVSQRASVNDPWGEPSNLGPTINTAANEFTPNVSIDGHRMYFARDPGLFGSGDIYVSRRQDKRDDLGWQTAENLGSPVNTVASESQPCIFEDEETGTTTLFFTLNHPGVTHADDIYASTLQPDGTFGPPAPVTELNTASNDRQVAIRRDGLEIFFGSDRSGTTGGIDLWSSTRASTSSAWSTPVNLGPVVNTTFADAKPSLSFDGTTLYFQSNRTGNFDLYQTRRSKLKGSREQD